MSRNEQARAEPVETIGPYRVVRELGRGGMGHVYEAVHQQLRKRVAIKILRAHLLEDQVSVQRFLREGRAACHVDHPHVVAVHELGSDAGAPYLVMELLDGLHLGERLRTSGPLPLEELTAIMLPVLSAVSAAHAAGIVHRDLKPSNIMLARSRDGSIVPKVLDFGTSKLHVDGGEQLLTITGAVLGTLHYMSPEQTRAPKDADARSDQYSLGVILYECATGKRPFSADSSYDLMHAIMTAPVEAPSAIMPSLPRTFDEVVLQAMSRKPGDRYASVRDFGIALLQFASEETARACAAELATTPEGVQGLSDQVGENASRAVARIRGAADPSASHASSTFADAVVGNASAIGWRWFGAIVLVCVVAVLVWNRVTTKPARERLAAPAAVRESSSPASVAVSASAPLLARSSTAPPESVAGSPGVPPNDAAAIGSAKGPRAASSLPSGAKEGPKAKSSHPRASVPSPKVRLGDNAAPILE